MALRCHTLIQLHRILKQKMLLSVFSSLAIQKEKRMPQLRTYPLPECKRHVCTGIARLGSHIVELTDPEVDDE
jgi:hypothetical protein